MNAAGEWNYDMDAAPKDGTRVLLAWKIIVSADVGIMRYRKRDKTWWDDSGIRYARNPFAWANINTPEVPK